MIVDFHTHILPGIDDGSSNVEMSIEMLKEEKRQGISSVILTPHFYAHHDTPEKFLKRREEAYQLLKKEADQYTGLPKLYLGAEVYYFDGIGQWEGLKQLAIEDTDYVLIEMPMPPWSKRMYKELEDISNQLGLIPIIAHIDRYITPLKTYGIPNKLSKLPVLVQANSSFFIKSLTSRFALKLVEKGIIHVIGSDCHNMTTRPPNLIKAIEKIDSKLGKEIVKAVNANEIEILS